VPEKLRTGLEKAELVEGVRITISGEVAEFKDGTCDQLIEAVDKLLYPAKKNGRNRIEMGVKVFPFHG
jgi:PleD family two-component response regulator